MSLQGASGLRARLKAIKVAFKPIGRAWADETARIASSRVPRRTGETARSIRRRNATETKATVVGKFTARFIDKGTKEHDEVARRAPAMVFQSHGRTIFAKKVHKGRQPARPFIMASAREGLRRQPMAEQLVDQWNRAA